MNPNVKSKRNAMLGKLFLSAQERGISESALRDDIAPGLIGKRLSAANEKEIRVVLERVAGPMKRKGQGSSSKGQGKYPSSIQGLRQEIRDLAIKRWGQGASSQGQGNDWERSLNNLCKRFGVDHHNFLDLRHGKAVKGWLVGKENQGQGSSSQ